jgi:hypothetical protein
MWYFFTPSLLAAVALGGHASSEAAMSVNKESPPQKSARGCGTAGMPAPHGRLMTRQRRCDSENQIVATESGCHV